MSNETLNLTKYITRRVRRLWEIQLGLCRWCGLETYIQGDPRRYRPMTRKLSGKAATLDHLYTKRNPMRQWTVVGQRYVMACNTCNSKPKYDEDRATLADLLRKRVVSDKPPLIVRIQAS